MGKYPPRPPSSDRIMFLLYLGMKINIFFHFGLQQPLLAFLAFIGLFWPLMSFLSQRISFWVKIKCKWTLSTTQMLKTVFEPYGSNRFTVKRDYFQLIFTQRGILWLKKLIKGQKRPKRPIKAVEGQQRPKS